MPEQNAGCSEHELKILKALMFGKISAANFNERFENDAVRISLLSKKWIGFDGSWYCLTINGRAAIPKEQVGGIKPQTISASTHATIKLDRKPLTIDQVLVASPALKTKSKTLQVLEFIEANPNCNGGFIGDSLNIERPINFIKAYIDKKQVLVIGNSGRGTRPQYRLADGLKLKDFYFYKKRISSESKITQKADPKPVIKEVQQEIPEVKFEYENDEALITYDNLNRISIDGHQLTAKKTSALLKFVHELGLVN